tara:strand:+ start:308 stop:595 length:288 start_codon:yes stop_codon:yes gene_type:complete
VSRSGSLLEALAHYLEALECTPPGYERYAAFEPADEALRELEPLCPAGPARAAWAALRGHLSALAHLEPSGALDDLAHASAARSAWRSLRALLRE